MSLVITSYSIHYTKLYDIGLIVPGLVPSPLGEVVNYAPSWVEISITLGVLALGIFVVSVLLKPALIIEQRYEAGR